MHKALIFLIFIGALSCSDDTTTPATDGNCLPGESFNPITGQCIPRGTPDPNTPDANGDMPVNDMTDPDPNNTPDQSQPDMPLSNDCTGTERRCNQETVELCVNGQFTAQQNCAANGETCFLGNCIMDTNSCEPGASRCISQTEYQNCQADGMTWGQAQSCPAERTCEAGECVAGCAGLLDEKSNVGCEYITMRHDQRSGLRTLPHTVVVSNPGDQPVTVQVTSPGGLNSGINSQTVQPLTSAVLNFPTSPMVSAAGASQNFYIIQSDRPVIATQFAPLNNPGIGSETSDASLLLPTNALGREYVVVGWPPGYIDIVSTQAGTVVQVSSPVSLSGGNAGSVPANGTGSFALGANTVLHLGGGSIFQPVNVDGVTITSNNPIAVYTGAGLVNIPSQPVRQNPPAGCGQLDASCATNDQCCSGICGYDGIGAPLTCRDSLAAGDHVEQQLFPVETWGQNYVAVPYRNRGINDFTLYKIVAARDNTTVTLSPAVNGLTTFTMNRGDIRQIYGPNAFEITADQPVMLGQYMIGGSISTSDDGDPAFMVPPAVQQFRDSYVFLVPGNYRRNYVTIMKRPGTTVTLDGNTIPQASFQATGGTLGWEYAMLDNIAAGVHTASSTDTFGIVVHGMDEYISYAFAGGVTLPE